MWGTSVNSPTSEDRPALWHVSPFLILHVYQDAEIPIIFFLIFEELDQSSKKWIFVVFGLVNVFMLSFGLRMSYHAITHFKCFSSVSFSSLISVFPGENMDEKLSYKEFLDRNESWTVNDRDLCFESQPVFKPMEMAGMTFSLNSVASVTLSCVTW